MIRTTNLKKLLSKRLGICKYRVFRTTYKLEFKDGYYLLDSQQEVFTLKKVKPDRIKPTLGTFLAQTEN